jgi:hypothetical protein
MKAEVSNHSQDVIQKLVFQLSRNLIVGRLRAISGRWSHMVLTPRINSGASWTLFCAVYFAKNRPACKVRFDAFVMSFLYS